MDALVKTLAILLFCYFCVDAAPSTKGKEPNDRLYTLVRAFPDTRPQVDILHKLRYEKKLPIEFWKPADWPGRHADLWVTGNTKKSLTDLLKKKNIFYMEKIKNWNTTEDNIVMKNIDHYDRKYKSVEEIHSELKRLAKGYKESVKLIEFGRSYENRSIYGIQIRKRTAAKKPLMFFTCGLHGREWLAIASCMYVIRMMIFNDEYENDLQVITNNFEIIIVPLVNPDGYVFTNTKGGRFWRKSRSKTKNRSCRGVDLNRNFGFRWGGLGASPDACDETYAGTRPFSEKETKAIARYLYKRRNDLKVFVDVHTYGQLLSYPWGFTKQESFHKSRHLNVLGGVSRRIFYGTGKRYRYGQTSNILYDTAGDSTDWVYGYLGVVHSYGVELMPQLVDRTSLAGFDMPPKAIIPSGRELFVVLSELARYSLAEGGKGF